MSKTLYILPTLFIGAFALLFPLDALAYGTPSQQSVTIEGGSTGCLTWNPTFSSAHPAGLDGTVYFGTGTWPNGANSIGSGSGFSFNVAGGCSTVTWQGGRSITALGVNATPGTYWLGIDDTDGNFYYIAFTVVSSGNYTPNNPVTPSSTNFNEVLRYWPGLNYSTTTGTTTIGAQFSIPHPELIDYIGFELDGSTDVTGTTTASQLNTLYTATTSVATAQTLSLTTDYNFTTGGYYTINAFFVQNGKKVYNRTVGTVLINFVPPNITVGSNGQFQFNGTTTVATSTYENLHIDCGTTLFVSDICKLAVAFVIPDASAVQGVRDNFNAILLRAPFSFFTDSKKLLDAFQLGTASTGGTFALTLYGANVPVISTTTAASVGLSSGTINTLKDLITIGMWILLAWYLYWRIASIFGV